MRRLAWVLLWLAVGGVPARAAAPIRRTAPEFPAEDVWLNAKPLTLARLRRHRVVLLAFFNTANVNSLRALRQLGRWHEAYALDGVMVIGVHTPLYGFQRNPGFMRRELARLKIDFPVVLDDDKRIWKSYENEGWPSFYILDRDGRVAFELEGEARYTELETELRAAAYDLGYDLPADSVAVDPPQQGCGQSTPESPVPRDKAIPAPPDGPLSALLTDGKNGTWSRRGPWKIDDDAVRLAAGTKPGVDEEDVRDLMVVYRGAQGFAVLGPPAGKKTRVYVRQDSLWLTTLNAGPDVEFDDDGHSYVEVDEPRFYSLTRNANDDLHLLSLQPGRHGAAVYAFSAADRCLPYAP